MSTRILIGDCREQLRTLPAESVHCCVTSPPYFGLRDYGVAGQIGLEPTPEEYTQQLVMVFREVRRVLRKDGTLWLNLGDSYASSSGERSNNNGTGASGLKRNVKDEASRQRFLQENKIFRGALNRIEHGLKPKDLIGVPWLVAFALRLDGWYLRQDIIWSKPNPMPESVRDRCTKAHEYIFLLSKSASYYYDADAIAEELAESTVRIHSSANVRPQGTGADWKQYNVGNGHSGLVNGNLRDGKRNKRSVWEVTTQPYAEAHFATFPPALIEPCIIAGCPEGGNVIDPFGGAGTTGLVADRLKRNAILIELNPEYAAMARRRIEGECPMFADVHIQAAE